jgi:hemin uptake protein HemP
MRIIIIHNENKMTASISGARQRESSLLEISVVVCETGSYRQVSSADLLGDSSVLAIQHQGESYVLRQTRTGKLILTK